MGVFRAADLLPAVPLVARLAAVVPAAFLAGRLPAAFFGLGFERDEAGERVGLFHGRTVVGPSG